MEQEEVLDPATFDLLAEVDPTLDLQEAVFAWNTFADKLYQSLIEATDASDSDASL